MNAEESGASRMQPSRVTTDRPIRLILLVEFDTIRYDDGILTRCGSPIVYIMGSTLYLNASNSIT